MLEVGAISNDRSRVDTQRLTTYATGAGGDTTKAASKKGFVLHDEPDAASSSDSNSTDYGLKHGHLIVNDHVH